MLRHRICMYVLRFLAHSGTNQITHNPPSHLKVWALAPNSKMCLYFISKATKRVCILRNQMLVADLLCSLLVSGPVVLVGVTQWNVCKMLNCGLKSAVPTNKFTWREGGEPEKQKFDGWSGCQFLLLTRGSQFAKKYFWRQIQDSFFTCICFVSL